MNFEIYALYSEKDEYNFVKVPRLEETKWTDHLLLLFGYLTFILWCTLVIEPFYRDKSES